MIFKSKARKIAGLVCCVALISCVQVRPLGRRGRAKPVGSVGVYPLNVAAASGDLNKVKGLLAAGHSVNNDLDEEGRSPLHYAAANGHWGVVDRLLRQGANIDAKDLRRATPLILASQSGKARVVQLLLEWKASVNARDKGGDTPLHWASRMGRQEVVEVLLQNGAEVDTKTPEKATPLFLASVFGQKQVVELLLQAGAEVDAADDEGQTPLSVAVLNRHHRVAERLLNAGACVDAVTQTGATALHFAAQDGHEKVVDKLLEAGAEVNARCGEGFTPLYVAAEHGQMQVVARLLKAGAEVNARCGGGFTPLCVAAGHGQMQVVARLLKAGAEVNARCDGGFTPLYAAAEHGQTQVVARLLKADAEVNARCGGGFTPLCVAAGHGQMQVVARLLKAGAEVNARCDGGFTPLYAAAEHGQTQVVARLLKAGAEVNACRKGGWTALHVAAENGHVEVVRRLLRAGADANARLKGGLTALDLATQGGHAEVVSALRVASDSVSNRGARNVKGRTPQVAGDKQELTAERVKSRRMEKLFAAISQSDLTSLRQCLESEIDPLRKNEHGNTALIAAIRRAVKAKESTSRRIVRELLIRDEIRGSVNEPGSKGVTALMVAVADAEIIGFLLDGCKQNIKLDCVDTQGQTVFAHAAHTALPRVMHTLLALAKDNVEPNDLWDILSRRDHKGNTAAMIAARSGKRENAELLLQAIESLAASNDERARHVSEQKEYVEQCRHSHPDTMSTIVSDEDDQKEEPVELQQAQKECIDLLRAGSWQQFNKSLRAHENESSWMRDQVIVDGQCTTVLHLALEATDRPSQTFFKKLLSATGSRAVNLTDYRGKQPLDLAIATGRRGLIKALLAHKAQVQPRHITAVAVTVAAVQNQSDQKHWQSLQDTMQRKLEVAAVAKPTEYTTKETVAAERQSDKQKQLLAKITSEDSLFKSGWIKELLATGYDVNERLEQQVTLLMRAAQAGSAEAVDALLKAGANVNAKDVHGNTAFAYASRAEYTVLANRLCVAMAAQDFKKKPSALGHIRQRHARKAPKSLKRRGLNVTDRPFFIEEMRKIRDNGKTTNKKCKAHQFPESWSKQKIQEAICTVLSNPQSVMDNHAEIDDSGNIVRGILAVEGVAHGLNMRVVVSNAREAARWYVFTAYPLPSGAR